VRDWPYSWFHRDVGAGVFPVDWGGDIEAIGELVSGGIGEANFKRGIAAWNGGLRLRLQSATSYGFKRVKTSLANLRAAS
jgi:hypothetical protein